MYTEKSMNQIVAGALREYASKYPNFDIDLVAHETLQDGSSTVVVRFKDKQLFGIASFTVEIPRPGEAATND